MVSDRPSNGELANGERKPVRTVCIISVLSCTCLLFLQGRGVDSMLQRCNDGLLGNRSLREHISFRSE